MKRQILTLLTLFLSLNVFSQNNGVGIGVVLGNPTGINAKLPIGEKSAIDATIGYFIGNVDGLRLTADYLNHPWSFATEQDMIKIFFGAGAGLGFISELSFSLRAPAGAGYYFHSIPLEAFVEIVPTLQIIGPEHVHLWMGGFLGARWYF